MTAHRASLLDRLRSGAAKTAAGVITGVVIVWLVFYNIEATSKNWVRWKALFHGEVGYFLWQSGTPKYERKRIRAAGERLWDFNDTPEHRRVELREQLDQVLDDQLITFSEWKDEMREVAERQFRAAGITGKRRDEAMARYMNALDPDD